MRWDAQKTEATTSDGGALLPLAGLVRSVRTPEFAGITFHEVLAKSALNRVPPTSGMPFSWTINPYRGCSHACVYCFARKTHSYLNLDTGLDFDSQLVVKTNIGEVLRREVAKPSWQREHVAMGTNTDPYQRAEGRYRLMPDIIRALAESGTSFSILTKGTLLSRDIPLLREAGRQVTIGMGISLSVIDADLSSVVEPGTPTPRARLDLISRLREAGLACGVMAMPILPWLTDSDEALDRLFAALAGAGATGVSVGALHLRPGAREWYMAWLSKHHPGLVGRYRRLYGSGTYASAEYRTWLAERVRVYRRRHGLAAGARFFRDNERADPALARAGSKPESKPGSKPERQPEPTLF
ncbi:radical SAM protein [Arthrobacter sp. JZ12]|uniref:Rv2578c family radical SAM protein n=1 Tax=Arthrobacter sp. JZ12 TaxID=2654190 RepID=UPI002B467B1A|nr:Rv2578c family radical SAM protein [Arthrobacter sp. JZ12]WRH24653.1 radical SAM protein [Arthrobacter sp. JZ12]